MNQTHVHEKPTQPWYMNISFDALKNAYPNQPVQQHETPVDMLTEMHSEKVDQSDRLLNHTAKAILTRTTLERSHARQRDEEAQTVRDHLVQFSDEPFGINQTRDKMRWSLEQNLMALSREDRHAQLSFWNDLWTMSRELLTCMNEHEKQNRKRSMMQAPTYSMPSRIP